jgi:amino acid adenylation domain-containing protein
MDSIVGYRLSPPQRRLWTLLQDGGTPLRHARVLLRLRGPVDPARLAAALDGLVARHETLRTAYERLPGMPEALQVVEERGLAREADEDLRALSAAEREARVEAAWAEAAEALPAVRLLRTGDGEHLLLLRVHPLSVDAASAGHLARDLAALYAAEEGGAPVDDEPVPYLAVSEWLNDVAGSDEAQAGRAWWARQMEGAPPVLPLERELPPPADDDEEAARRAALLDEPASARRTLSSAVAEAAASFAASAEADADTVLLAAWTALLHRLGAGRGVRVGVAFDGRADDELRHAVGPFTQHLPITFAVPAEGGFRALVDGVLGTLDEAAGWQECHDGDAVRERVFAEGAALRMGFTAVPAGEAHAGGGVELAVARTWTAEEPFALHLRVHPGDGAPELELRGGPTVAPAQLPLLLDRFEALLADALERPDAPLSALARMSAAERERVLRAFNPASANASPTEADADADADADGGTVLDAIRAQAARTPDAPALRHRGGTVTYAALEARANRRAHHLRSLGVGPETRVGIMLPPSPERVETVLAVLKAGGAFLPLDPAYPHDRLDFMIRDAGVRLVLTSAELADRVPAESGATVVRDEDGEAARGALPETDPGVPLHPASAAYVIYTSGSTGAPKGVLVEHGPLAAHARAVRAHYGLGPDDRILQYASFNFDPSVEQTLPPLAAGACVVLRDEAEPGLEALGRYVAEGLTILNLPTAQWHVLADAAAGGERVPGLEALRLVIAGGEAMLPRFAERWAQTPARGARLLNAYGPTEAVVTAATFDVPAGFRSHASAVPIGRAFGARAAYVLEGWEPAPAGVPGELCLGGATLARGYLGRPALTAERFAPDPFGAPGARMYRTGDRARWDEAGTLEFLGRADHQVKVRGYRIELGEVEAALDRHPNVRQSAVVVEDKGQGEKQLAAYWIPAEEPLATPQQLRLHLLEHLPEYMVPGVFVALETMPLTAVGKVDRGRLPAGRRLRSERPYVAPSTPTEEQVAAIWGEVMHQERVSMDDNFFAAGGHSLLATQLTTRLRRHFEVDLQIGQVFDAQTVADLARTVDALVAAGGPGAADETIGRAPRERVRGADLAGLLDT